jgi:hypothetical protein
MNWTSTIMRGQGCDPPDHLAGCDSSLSADYVFLPRRRQPQAVEPFRRRLACAICDSLHKIY